MPVPAPTMSAPLVGCGGKVCRGGAAMPSRRRGLCTPPAPIVEPRPLLHHTADTNVVSIVAPGLSNFKSLALNRLSGWVILFGSSLAASEHSAH